MNAQTKKTSKAQSLAQVLSAQDVTVPMINKKSNVNFSIWIRALLQNWRQGTVGCKDRSEVAFTNKKPWKQKGTGRARAGGAASPLWRHGGVTFGPQPRTRTLKVMRGVKGSVLGTIFAQRMNEGSVFLLDWEPSEMPKTTAAFAVLKSAELHNKKVVLFVTPDDVLTYVSYANIPNVRLIFFDQVNAFDAAHGDSWVILKKDLEHFKEMVSRWI